MFQKYRKKFNAGNKKITPRNADTYADIKKTGTVMKDTKIRSIVKTITFRILATLTTMLLVFIITKKLTLALTIGIIETIAKLILYYFHERIWENISWKRE